MTAFIDNGEPGTWARQLAYRSLPCQQVPSGRLEGTSGEVARNPSPGNQTRAASTPRSPVEQPLTRSTGHTFNG